MQKSYPLSFVVLLLIHLSTGQTGNTQTAPAPPEQQTEQPAAPQQSAETSNFTSAKGFVLEDATPVKLRFSRTVSSADAHVGDTVDFEVLQDVSVNGTLVIPKSGVAFGTVTEAQPKRRMARGGKLEINIDYVKVTEWRQSSLACGKRGQGRGPYGRDDSGHCGDRHRVLSCCAIFPVHARQGHHPSEGSGVHGLCQRRHEARYCEISAGEPAPQKDLSAGNHDHDVSLASAKLQIESSPPGADIEVDGSFVGNTPSDVQVEEGEHTVAVKRAGFKNWERIVKSSAGSSVHISAELEKADNP